MTCRAWKGVIAGGVAPVLGGGGVSAHEYPHSVGPAVIGVQVDRGSAIPDLAGAYDPIDMTGPVWARGSDGVGQLDVQAGGVQTSFRRGQDGELYLLTRDNGLFELEPA